MRRDVKQAAFPGFVGQQEPILKTCGTVKASLLGKLKNQVGGRVNHFVIAAEFLLRESGNILPTVAGQNAHGTVETILCVRLLNINLDSAVRTHFRMNNFRGII